MTLRSDPDSAVGRSDPDRCTAAIQRSADLGAGPSMAVGIAGDDIQRGNVAAKSAVYCTGLDMSRIVLRDRDVHAAIQRVNVEARSFPSTTRQRNTHTTVLSTAAEIACYIHQAHATIHRRELGRAIDIADRDAAVVSNKL